MGSIVQLSQSLINKIAAGEVVERPLSVVKELTENAIDAGASVITVEIRDGGLSMIRVTDNGGGIPSEDLPLAFARHATSKISSFEDLMRVGTLGFRGEALSSIAAVAQVEMITKTQDAVMGTRVEIHGGKLVSSRDIGSANGTTLIISNLFFNTPARRKFLKKPSTEAGYISQCLERLALGSPRLVIRYINNGEIVFQTNGNGELKTTLLNIYGREAASKVISVDVSAGEMSLFGFVGKPEIARGNRQHGSFFINGRLIQSKLMTKAVESAMKTMLPSGKFPLYALKLDIPPESLDVNVHPTKMDVRFADEEGVYLFVEDALRDALSENNLIPTVRWGGKATGANEPEATQIEIKSDILPVYAPKSAAKPSYVAEKNTPYSQAHEKKDLISVQQPPYVAPFEKNHLIADHAYKTTPYGETPPETTEETTEAPPQKRFFEHYQIHGLIFSAYWLVAQGESLFLIDQHAAHERILYEEFLEKSRQEPIHAQRLIAPIPLRLTPREREIFQENKDLFARFGFEISSGDEPAILSVPFLMKGPVNAVFFTDLLDKISDAGFSKDSPYTHKTEIIAMAACKAAVKAGDNLVEDEAQAMVEKLLRLQNPFTCPHGRPTIIEITKNELERRFKRK